MDSNQAPYTPTRSPNKRRRKLPDVGELRVDYDDTPRGFGESASLPPPSSTSSALSRSARSQSPSKGLDALRGADYPLMRKSFGHPAELPSDEMRSFVRDLRRIANGQGIVHSDQRAQYFQELDDGVLDIRAVSSHSRDALGSSPSIDWARKRVKWVHRNQQSSASEAQWNCNTHWPLMEEANDLSIHLDRSIWHNVTSSGIRPWLLPVIDSVSAKGKKADFALCLDLTKHVTDKLYHSFTQGLSHFDYSAISYSPAAVMVETKTQGGNMLEGSLQLATCALAHVKKLKDLVKEAGNPSASLPLIPLLITQDAKWFFCCLEPLADQAVLWEELSLGSVSTVLGVLQITTVLQYFQNWANTEFRTWFEKNITEPLMEKG